MPKRLDVLLAERGLSPSREQAQRAVMAGLVYVDGKRVDKPGQPVREEAALEIMGGQPYVSRGGEKLAGALAVFPIRVSGRICLDLGASTGGFTDCLLQNGAARVYAVDVGHGQLAWKLRQDPRVMVMEGVNARYLERDSLLEAPDLITMDLAFISLELILPAAVRVMDAGGDLLALIKPQFEAGRGQVGKRGVVRHPEIHREVLRKILTAAASLGLGLQGLTHSPLRGPEGNLEFFAWWNTGRASAQVKAVEAVVEQAHGMQ